MLDSRSGTIVAAWRAHDGYITKVSMSLFVHFLHFCLYYFLIVILCIEPYILDPQVAVSSENSIGIS